MNCTTCDNALIRKFSDEAGEIICTIDKRPMKRDYVMLSECSKYREIKPKKEKG